MEQGEWLVLTGQGLSREGQGTWPGRAEQNMEQQMQRALSGLRKQQRKVGKTVCAMDNRKAKWEAYQNQIRNGLIAEQKKFKDTAELTEQLEKAKHDESAAQMELKAFCWRTTWISQLRRRERTTTWRLISCSREERVDCQCPESKEAKAGSQASASRQSSTSINGLQCSQPICASPKNADAMKMRERRRWYSEATTRRSL